MEALLKNVRSFGFDAVKMLPWGFTKNVMFWYGTAKTLPCEVVLFVRFQFWYFVKSAPPSIVIWYRSFRIRSSSSTVMHWDDAIYCDLCSCCHVLCTEMYLCWAARGIPSSESFQQELINRIVNATPQNHSTWNKLNLCQCISSLKTCYSTWWSICQMLRKSSIHPWCTWYLKKRTL